MLSYILQNWTLILILLAFTATLRTTVFLDRKTIDRMYVLIVVIFLLSICVYVEFLPGAPHASALPSAGSFPESRASSVRAPAALRTSP